MKKYYLGFIPIIIIELWSLWYIFLVSHDPNGFDLLLALAIIILTATIFWITVFGIIIGIKGIMDN